MIEYTVRLADVRRHIFEVDCRVDGSVDGVTFEFASWIPGSYLLREYARHVVSATAFAADGSDLSLEKIAHNAWRSGASSQAITLRLQVYALDESVRGAWLDTRRAYFNGPCLFARPLGYADDTIRLNLEAPQDGQPSGWRVATAMRAADTDDRGFGEYAPDDYDDLLDQPFEIGVFDRVDFDVEGTPHSLVVAGEHDGDLQRLARDLQTLCATQIRFFGGRAPFDRYVFLCVAVANGYGGLEHRCSSSLMFSRDDLPVASQSGDAQYARLLSLASHEYFHAWHVKRTRPAALTPYRLAERNHTRLLWVFEGITSYYQDRFVLRSGLIDAQTYLSRLADTISSVLRVPGRHLQSLSDSSFDAWDKLYKPEANSPNAGVSYYSKGAVVALALDLTIRRHHDSRISLDTLILALWEQYGAKGIGVPEDGFESLAKQIAGTELAGFFDKFVRGTDDPPLAELFADFAVDIQFIQETEGGVGAGNAASGETTRLWLGIAPRPSASGVECMTVFSGGPAQHAGINPGDTIVALAQRRVTSAGLARLLGRFREGQTVEATVFRGEDLLTFDLTLQQAPAQVCRLQTDAAADERATQAQRSWLYQD